MAEQGTAYTCISITIQVYNLQSEHLRYGKANMSIRPVKRMIESKPTVERAGVHLRRAFGFGSTADFDSSAAPGKFCNASAPLAVPTEGEGGADAVLPTTAENRMLVLFDRGDEVTVEAGREGVRFLLVSGRPLEEPVAWYGPIVMNTQEQLRQAFEELDRGTFLMQ
jgi:redox-sensitive bicupin YhaK (pirin superfamily)